MNVLRPPNQPSATQRINPFALNQVILVGLSTELSQLSKTIQRIKKALEEPTGIFQDFDIQVIDKLDLSGSRTTLVHQLNALAEGSRVQPFENLVILFVGHAETQSSYRLMLPERIMKSPLEPEARDWLRWDTFREWVSPIQTKNLLLMLDTPQAQGLRSKETLQWLRSLHQTEPGQKLLFFSNSHNQRGWRSKNSTYFAEALCTGLEQWEARDDRGVIDTDRLFQYLQKSIPERGLGNAEICQPPSRLQWPESSKHPMSLTYEKNRTELDGRLKNSLAIGKCLIWVGESLKHRCAPKAFPTRRQWKHHQQRAWIEYADSQRNPGLASVQLSAFGFPLLDSGVDSALERACVKQGYRIWYPNQPNPMQASSSQRKQALFRLSGAISTSNYVYEWEELEQQFKYFCEDFTQKPKWDSLLVIGIPFEEPTFRRWLKKLQQTIHNCWLVFPDEESYDRAQLLQKEGFRLIFGPENNILQQLQTIANLKTKGIKTEIIDVPLPEKNSPQISSIASAPNPYPGLLPFNQNQYDQFFGRSGCNGQKGELGILREEVKRHKQVLMYGPSGVGKTSLLQAGLYPTLEKEGYRILSTDAESPLEDLASQINEEPCLLGLITPQNVLERIGYLSYLSNSPILISFDHLERAFSREPSVFQKQGISKDFLHQLEEAIKQLKTSWPNGQWRLLFTLQSEKYTLLRDFIEKQDKFYNSQIYHFELHWLNEEQARESMQKALPLPFKMDEALFQRLLLDLRQTGSRLEPNYHPTWIQVVCRQIFERSREAGETTLTLKRYNKNSNSLKEWMHTWLTQHTLNWLPRKASHAAREILTMLISSQGIRRQRPWKELLFFLQKRHKLQHLEEARDILTQRQVIQDCKHSNAIELTHDVWIETIWPFCVQDIELSNRVNLHLKALKKVKAPLFPKPLMKELKHKVSFLEWLTPAHRKEAEQKYESSKKHYKKRQLLLVMTSLLLCLALGLGWFFFWPQPVEKNIHTKLTNLIQDKSKTQSHFWLGVEYFKKPKIKKTAEKKLLAMLQIQEGKTACKVLQTLYHIGRIDITRFYQKTKVKVKKNDRLHIQALQCPPNIRLKQLKLTNTVMLGAVLAEADLTRIELQNSDLRSVDFHKSTLRGAKLQMSDLRMANLKNADLESSRLTNSRLENADLRGAKLKNADLYGINLAGALLSSHQLKHFVRAGASLRSLRCFSSQKPNKAPFSPAVSCYKWHRGIRNQRLTRPRGCPLKLRGPILALPQPALHGICPSKIRKQIDRMIAFCPTYKKKACQYGVSCRRGEQKGCFQLARLYHEGSHVKKNGKRAYLLFRRACALRHAASCHELALLYRIGRHVRKDLKRSVALLEEACQFGMDQSCMMLALSYQSGIGSKRNIDKAKRLYEQACRGKISRACTRLGILYEQGHALPKDLSTALRYFQKACKLDSSVGCYRLGSYQKKYTQAKALAEKNQQKAIPLLQRDCEQKNIPESCSLLGYTYEKGKLLKASLAKAKALYTKACLKFDGFACARLGRLYQEGKGFRKDLAKALKLFQKACSYNDAKGCENLAFIYERGQLVTKNRSKARLLYQKACSLGSGWGCTSLADLYFYGKGVKKNKSKAEKLYKSACKLGVNSACK